MGKQQFALREQMFGRWEFLDGRPIKDFTNRPITLRGMAGMLHGRSDQGLRRTSAIEFYDSMHDGAAMCC